MNKEAKKSGKLTREEFIGIVTVMADVPRKEKETQRDYFERIRRYGVSRSRFTMQIIEAALKDEKDPEKAYEVYRDKMKETTKRKEPEAEEQIPGQMQMEIQPAEEQKETIDQAKMIRFQAGQFTETRTAVTECTDRITEAISDCVVMINMKLDQLNDTMSMILRAIRKE